MSDILRNHRHTDDSTGTSTVEVAPTSGTVRSGHVSGELSEAGVSHYRRHGYVVVDGALSAEDVARLNDEATDICRGRRGEVRGVTPAAPDLPDADVIEQYLCIHFPHKISSVLEEALAHPALVGPLTRLIGPNVKCMQSMLFIKAAGKPGQAWHQDEFFIPTRDRSLLGAWIALDDATVENGCLWVIPGSQRQGIIWPQHIQDDQRFDCTGEAGGFPYSDDDAVPVEMSAGSIVFFNGYLLHRSLPNRAPTGFRRSLVHHYMSAESLLPWTNFEPGQRIATADYRDIVMVAGSDPYEWKGIEDYRGAHVRPSGEGGCAEPTKSDASTSTGQAAIPARP
jgi:ectoine hydroxylase-related dioxygenase (phytanoyl-CoA dioxygenase family)